VSPSGDLDATGTVTAGGFVGTPQTLTDAATITYDLADGHNANVTLTANRTLALPTNITEGASGVLTITQDSTGGHSLALAPGWFSLEGSASSISTLGPGDQAQIDWYATSSTKVSAKIKPLQYPLSSAYLYVAADDSADLASILAGTYDFTTTDAIDGTIVVATEEGTYSAGISLDAATTYDLYSQGVSLAHNGPLDTPVGYLISALPLSDGEIEQIEAHFVSEGAAPKEAFGSFTNFNSAWNGCNSLTSFPAIDVSSGLYFSSSWQNCSSLTSFPLIDMSGVESVANAWYGCSSLASFPALDLSSSEDCALAWRGCTSLTSFPSIDVRSCKYFPQSWRDCSSLEDFPANFFDNWSPASITTAVFSLTWDGCSSLTNTSVENILTSIDTSGIYGTDTGLSSGTQLADHTIDIDYDGTSLSSATTTAIANLKNKDWAININNVIQ